MQTTIKLEIVWNCVTVHILTSNPPVTDWNSKDNPFYTRMAKHHFYYKLMTISWQHTRHQKNSHFHSILGLMQIQEAGGTCAGIPLPATLPNSSSIASSSSFQGSVNEIHKRSHIRNEVHQKNTTWTLAPSSQKTNLPPVAHQEAQASKLPKPSSSGPASHSSRTHKHTCIIMPVTKRHMGVSHSSENSQKNTPPGGGGAGLFLQLFPSFWYISTYFLMCNPTGGTSSSSWFLSISRSRTWDIAWTSPTFIFYKRIAQFYSPTKWYPSSPYPIRIQEAGGTAANVPSSAALPDSLLHGSPASASTSQGIGQRHNPRSGVSSPQTTVPQHELFGRVLCTWMYIRLTTTGYQSIRAKEP